MVKTLAFVIGLLIGAVGAAGILAPSGLVWIAEHFVTPGAFYVIATVRVAFGVVLISWHRFPGRQGRFASWAISS